MKLMKNKLDKKVYIIMLIGIMIGIIISTTLSYTLAATLVNSKDVYYEDNSGLAVNNVQAAIDGTCTKFSNELTNFLNKIYPVGTIYTSTASTNPSSFLGGTWEAYGKGQTLVGIDGNQTEFNTVEKTGGAKSVSYTPSGSIGSTTLTEKQIPSHSHVIPSLSGTAEKVEIKGTFGTLVWFSVATGTGAFTNSTPNINLTAPGGPNIGASIYSLDASHSHTVTTTASNTKVTGGGESHTHSFTGTATTINNLQPYVTVYMWRRTK